MLTLTILWGAFVHGAAAQDLAGVTTLSLAECLSAPAARLPATTWSFQVRPAAYGHPDLSDAAVCVQMAQTPLLMALRGTSGGGWTELHGLVQHRWSVTDAFVVGTMAAASWSGARGFASDIGLNLSLHTRLLLDPTWSVVCGLDNLLQHHTRFQPPSQALRLGASWEGAVAASAHLAITADHGAQAVLQAAGMVADRLRIRGTVTTAPITIAAAGQLANDALLPITLELRWVADLGVRTSLAVDLP